MGSLSVVDLRVTRPLRNEARTALDFATARRGKSRTGATERREQQPDEPVIEKWFELVADNSSVQRLRIERQRTQGGVAI